ncbi:MAG TPA: hypothetical protein G4N93_03920 [Dehalococcoidia bacterium]|nr:hypothetical protein [Dehalococcoidia bacterium]
MRTLSATLLAEQKLATKTPYVKVEAKNLINGVVRLDWSRLYAGSEVDCFHALAMPGDGSLIRLRVTPPGDSRKLYYQRVTNPDENSDYTSWTYLSIYNAVIVASCAEDSNVSQFYIRNTRAIYHRESTDNGANWGSWSLIGYTPTTAIYGIAADYKSNGDIALFYADQATLYVMKRISGSWGSASSWGKSTGDLSGVATVYDSDWNLLVTGKDTSGNYKLWSVIYGDGGDVSSGNWSALKEIASAESGAGFEYHRVFIDKPASSPPLADVYRAFYVDGFTGTESYNRPFWTHSIPGTTFLNNLWREPVPFNLSSEYGLAVCHDGAYCWLSSPNGVWRASLVTQTLDLTSDILSARLQQNPDLGSLVIELDNSEGDYASLPSPLDIGCQINFSPGYVTSLGNEVSLGLTFILEAYEYISAGGKSMLALHAFNSWKAINLWKARHQFRWNKSANELSIKGILEFILARVGLKLEVVSQSTAITGTYHEFTINPNNRGLTVVSKLLSFVPDVIFFEGQKAYLVNPQSSDSSVYSYVTPQNTDHPLFEGRYFVGASKFNRIQVEGLSAGGSVIISENFDWDEINNIYDRFKQVYYTNLDTLAKAQSIASAYFREAEIESAKGIIRIPVNCGQQLYDVIDITDSRSGFSAEKKRVMGLVLVYKPSQGLYEHRLWLGAV